MIPNIETYIPQIRTYDQELERQNLWWSTVAMVGKVNNQGMDDFLLDSISDTQEQFERLRHQLINSMSKRYIDKIQVTKKLKAQAFIDILNRNLFERTADVGFLATDQQIIHFLSNPKNIPETRPSIQARLKEYADKYTVYEDIALILPSGELVAQLSNDTPSHTCACNAFKAALNSTHFIESDRRIDIFPQTQMPLSYWHSIRDKQGKVLGVLCLSFKFADELQQISDSLKNQESTSRSNLILLNRDNEVLFSENPNIKLPKKLPTLTDSKLELIQLGTLTYLCYSTHAQGYQGFAGLPWKSVYITPIQDAFNNQTLSDEHTLDVASALYPKDLHELNLEINTALLIVVLNGKITSLKNKVVSFLPVLDSFKEIGDQITQIFTHSIAHIHQITHQTMENELSCLAKLAMEIMDRNLYERANDCRWWALNSEFQQLLDPTQTQPNAQITKQLNETLSNINKLYTVYQQIFIFDTNHQVLGQSNLSNNQINQILTPNSATQALQRHHNSQHYFVSEFSKNVFSPQPTYTYYAAIPSHDNTGKVIGGIGLVFNAQDEFLAILNDFLPRQACGKPVKNAFALFIDKQHNILSITENPLNLSVGDSIPLPLSNTTNITNGSFSIQFKNQSYLAGYQASQGYREYKNGDGYENQIIALVVVPC